MPEPIERSLGTGVEPGVAVGVRLDCRPGPCQSKVRAQGW